MRDLSEWLRGWSRETPFRLALGPSFEHGHRSVTAGTVGDLRDALEVADRAQAEVKLEAKGGELGGLMFHVQEVARVWLELHPTQRADVSPDLADALDELAERAGVSS